MKLKNKVMILLILLVFTIIPLTTLGISATKSVQEYRQILNDATNRGDSYAFLPYQNEVSGIKYEVLTPRGQDYLLTRYRAKNTEIYDLNQLIFREHWTVYKNISRDLNNQFGRMKHKVRFKPQTENNQQLQNNISLTNSLQGLDRASQPNIGGFSKSLTVENNNYAYTANLNGNFQEHKLLWTVYLPNNGIHYEELNCRFTEGGFTFDVCSNNMEFITRFDNELLFGFGTIGNNKEVRIEITKT